jgi:DNA-binding NarL/FixJ family response regulator
MNYNILVIEDHPIVVEGLKKLLEESGLARLCLTASTGKESLTFLKEFSPDVVLLDINLPDVNGIDLCKTLKQEIPSLNILAISSFNQRSCISRMLDNGALGYVLKNASEEEIIDAVKDVATGKKHLSFEVSEILNRTKKTEEFPLLTRRETEVLMLIADGYTNQEIADKIFVSPLTVDSHRKNLLTKLNARNTAALIKIAITKGLIQNEEGAF